MPRNDYNYPVFIAALVLLSLNLNVGVYVRDYMSAITHTGQVTPIARVITFYCAWSGLKTTAWRNRRTRSFEAGNPEKSGWLEICSRGKRDAYCGRSKCRYCRRTMGWSDLLLESNNGGGTRWSIKEPLINSESFSCAGKMHQIKAPIAGNSKAITKIGNAELVHFNQRMLIHELIRGSLTASDQFRQRDANLHAAPWWQRPYRICREGREVILVSFLIEAVYNQCRPPYNVPARRAFCRWSGCYTQALLIWVTTKVRR